MRRSLLGPLLALCVSTAFAGCAGAQPATGVPVVGPQNGSRNGRSMRHATQPIAHLIVIMQQDRTFNDLFAGYPGATTSRYGCENGGRDGSPGSLSSGCPSGDIRVRLKAARLAAPLCLTPAFASYFRIAWNNGRMDGWNRLNGKDPLCPYTRVERGDTREYWALAKSYAVADQMFASTVYGFFPNQFYLIAATSEIARKVWVVGPPDRGPGQWGCDAPPGSRTSILKDGKILLFQGPYPCFTQFPTMANLFDNAGVSWKYYYDHGSWSPFASIKYVFEGPDRKRDLSSPATNVFGDIANGNLAAVSWVLSPQDDSDQPDTHDGPRWVNALVQAVMKSNYWKSAAIVVLWSDPGDGQYYDNVAPPQLDEVGLGFRVPMIVVSPYAKRHFVSHTVYEFGSVLKFMEENWNLPPLGGYATDRRANSISDMFDFSR